MAYSVSINKLKSLKVAKSKEENLVGVGKDGGVGDNGVGDDGGAVK